MSPIEEPAPGTAAGREAGSGSRALDLVLLLAPLVLLALFFRDLWSSAQAFSIESADNLDVVYPIFDRFFAELKQGGCREYGKQTLGVLNADGPPRESRQSGRVPQVEIPRGEEVRLHVQADTPAHVVLGIHRHPWWEARVAGRPASCAPRPARDVTVTFDLAAMLGRIHAEIDATKAAACEVPPRSSPPAPSPSLTRS